MPEAVREQLEELRIRSNAPSRAEVIRRALILYDDLWKIKDQGGDVIVRLPKQKDQRLLVL